MENKATVFSCEESAIVLILSSPRFAKSAIIKYIFRN